MGTCFSKPRNNIWKQGIIELIYDTTHICDDVINIILDYIGCFNCYSQVQKLYTSPSTGISECEQCLYTKYLCIRCQSVYGIPIKLFDNVYTSRFFAPYTCDLCQSVETYKWT